MLDRYQDVYSRVLSLRWVIPLLAALQAGCGTTAATGMHEAKAYLNALRDIRGMSRAAAFKHVAGKMGYTMDPVEHGGMLNAESSKDFRHSFSVGTIGLESFQISLSPPPEHTEDEITLQNMIREFGTPFGVDDNQAPVWLVGGGAVTLWSPNLGTLFFKPIDPPADPLDLFDTKDSPVMPALIGLKQRLRHVSLFEEKQGEEAQFEGQGQQLTDFMWVQDAEHWYCYFGPNPGCKYEEVRIRLVSPLLSFSPPLWPDPPAETKPPARIELKIIRTSGAELDDTVVDLVERLLSPGSGNLVRKALRSVETDTGRSCAVHGNLAVQVGREKSSGAAKHNPLLRQVGVTLWRRTRFRAENPRLQCQVLDRNDK